MTFSYDEAVGASSAYFGGDKFAAQKFVAKYALRNEKDELLELTPDDTHRRLAREFARIEAKYPNPMSEDEIFGLLQGFKEVVAQGSPMSGVGNPYHIQSLSNCFVIPSPYDSYGGILHTDQEQVQIMKRRGGVGFDLSTVRPKGLHTSNAALTTDGIEVFMERWSNSCREVAQKGRRGALMLTLSCHHPQIRDFIRIKRDLKKVTGANISVRLSDEFMRAVCDGQQVQLRFPVEKDAPHSVENMVDARGLWDELIESAHGFAEPGLLFWDNIISMSPADIYAAEGFGTLSTNPCGELPLSAYDSCRLMLINLFGFISDPFSSRPSFDIEKFRVAVIKAQRLMDDLVDLELENIDAVIRKVKADPEPEHIKATELRLWENVRHFAAAGRRTGLGVTALGDAVAAMGMRYGSDTSIDWTESVYRELALQTYRSSAVLAQERGAFSIHDYERERAHPFLRRLFDADPELEDMVKAHGRRNIACNTTSPAGTVSSQTRTTSGFECAFLLDYMRRAKVSGTDENAKVAFTDEMGDQWEEFNVLHRGFEMWMDVTGHGPQDVQKSPYWKATSADVDWEAKVRMQGAAQRWIDHSISNTTNIPENTPIEVTKRIYMLGWETGCFPADAGIMTSTGVTEIRDIRPGDLVYGQDGKLHSVEQKFALKPERRVLVTIEPFCREPLQATAEHPIAVMLVERCCHDVKFLGIIWKEAKDVTTDDYVLLPRLENRLSTGQNSIRVSDFVGDVCVDDGIAFPTRSIPWKPNRRSKSAGAHGIKNDIQLTDEFLEFLGWFIAEGHYAGSAVRLNFAMHERHVAERLAVIVRDVFSRNLSPNIFETNGNGGRSLRLEFGSILVARLLEKLVGRGSRNKHLPPFFTALEVQKLRVLIGAHFEGDAGVTISRRLARELYLARLLCGSKPKFKLTHRGKCHLVDEVTTQHSWVHDFDGFLVTKVKRVSQSVYEHEVFNLAVADTDTYIVNGTLVHNCKGVTVYREGSRAGVLLKKEDAFTVRQAPKRPVELPCHIHHVNVKNEAWTILVGLMDGKPYEVFGGLSRFVEIPKKYDEGIISKNARKTTPSTYDLHVGNGSGFIIKDVVEQFDNPNHSAMTRVISLALRHGADIKYVVEQLQKDKDSNMFSFVKVISRVLKTYVADGTQTSAIKSCPTCSGDKFAYIEGCISCVKCAWSKCG